MDAIAKPFLSTMRELVALGQRTSFNFGGVGAGLGGVARGDIEQRLGQLREMQRILETPASNLGLFDRARRALIPDKDTFSLDRIKSDIARLDKELQGRFLANAQAPPGFAKPMAAAATDAFAALPKPPPAANLGTAAADADKVAKATRNALAAFQSLRGELDPLVAAGNTYAESLRTIATAAATGKVSQDSIRAAVAGVTAEFQKARTEGARTAAEDFRALQEQLVPAIAAGREYARTIQIIDAAARAGVASQAEIAQAVGGATKAYDEARKAAEGIDLGKSIGVQFSHALDSLLEFTTTGKASIRDFASSAVADLQKAAAQALIVEGLMNLAGSLGGGAGKFLTQLAGNFGGPMAEGGSVRRGKTFLVGEKGPELFVPPSRGTIIPNGEGGGGKTPVNITNVFDGMQMVDAMETREGEDVVLRIMQRNRGKLREIIG